MVTNGFDGALTMLGLIMGFYVSESVERRKELTELEGAMVTELTESAHGKAACLIPFMIALVNGLAPVVFSLLIIAPLWLAEHGLALPLNPFEISILVSFVIIFLSGIFLDRVSAVFWFTYYCDRHCNRFIDLFC